MERILNWSKLSKEWGMCMTQQGLRLLPGTQKKLNKYVCHEGHQMARGTLYKRKHSSTGPSSCTWSNMALISLLPGRTVGKPYWFWSSLPLWREDWNTERTANYLIDLKTYFLLNVSNKIKFQKTMFSSEKNSLLFFHFVFALPWRFGFASLKKGSVKIPYSRLSQSTIRKVVTVSL